MESKIEKNIELVSSKDYSANLLNKDNPVQNIEPQISNKCKSYIGIFYALLGSLSLSFSNILIRKADFFNATDSALVRCLIQLAIILLIGCCSKTNIKGPKDARKTLVLIGLFSILVIISFIISIKLINPGDSQALFQLNMVFIPIIARFYLKEKFSLFNLLSLIMSMFGVFFIAQPSFLFKENPNLVHASNCSFNSSNCSDLSLNEGNSLNKILGLIAGLLPAFFSSIVAVLLKQMVYLKIHYSVPMIYQTFVGIPVSFSISLILFLTGFQVYNMNLVDGLFKILNQVLFLVFGSIFAVLLNIFYIWALKYEDTSKVAMILTTSVLFTFLFQYLILNIESNLFSAIGALLILIAVLFIILFQILQKILLKDKKTQRINSEDEIPSWKKILFYKI